MTNNKIITIDNLKIISNKHVLITVNPKIYSLDIIQAAAYVLMDRAYIIIDGDPKKSIFVELKPINNKENLEKLGRDFNNELINYAVYKVQAERTKNIRETIVQRALLTNLGEEINSILNQKQDQNTYESKIEEDFKLPEIGKSDKQDYNEDPEKIMIPWDEKVSNNKEKNKSCN